MVIELVNNNNIYYNKKNTACQHAGMQQNTNNTTNYNGIPGIPEYQNTSILAAITVAIRAI